MKTATQWSSEYAESHQNETNIWIHTICVPAIFLSIIGLLKTIPFGLDLSFNIGDFLVPFNINVLSFSVVFIMIFYYRLSSKIFLRMQLFTVLCLVIVHYLALTGYLFQISLAIFIIAWIGQFYGHKVEGKKPSFFKDLQFLLIGPVWVFEKMFK